MDTECNERGCKPCRAYQSENEKGQQQKRREKKKEKDFTWSFSRIAAIGQLCMINGILFSRTLLFVLGGILYHYD